LAQTIVGNKIRSGEIIRASSCEQCGASSQTTHGHHDDYAKPLDVRWLCPSCHRKWHQEHGEGANAH
jgi:transposase-like protein